MYYKVCSFFNKWLIEELKTYLPAQEYLARRAFSKMAINHFQLGYCPTGEQVVSRCIEEAKKNNILITDLLKAGILQEHQERSSFRKSLYHIPFDDRIVFPIFDSLGKPIAFSGRVFQMGDERVKYYNTSSNGEFFKKKVLYNFDKARSFIHKAQEVLMVEGYCDVIGLWHMGHYNVYCLHTRTHSFIIKTCSKNYCSL